MEGKIYEAALRNKARFTSTRGMVSMEDLWDLSLEELDDIAKKYYTAAKDDTAAISFIGKKTTAVKVAQMHFDIVKSVIDVKLAEKEAAVSAAEKKAQKQRILELIAEKQDGALAKKSIADLQAMLANLD